MNRYWSGIEDVDFLLTGPASLSSTQGGTFDPAWARASVGVSGIGNNTWPLTNSISNPASFGNRSLFWQHFDWNKTSALTSNSTIAWAFADSGGVARLLVRGTGTSGQLKLSSRNAAGTITDFAGATTAAGAFQGGTRTKIDFFVNYSTTGQFSLYINGILAADTGAGVNVTTDGATSLSFFYMSSPFTGSSDACLASQVAVVDSDSRAIQVLTLNSAVAGHAQTFAGTANNVNKALINDATFITAASAGLINQYQSGGIVLPGGTYAVVGVGMTARALIGTQGPQNLEYATRVGSTDYTGGQWAPQLGTFSNDVNTYFQATNPGTGLPWTTADIAQQATFNYGVESVT